jgi:hypothetical protein
MGVIPKLPEDEWIDKVVALLSAIVSPVIYILSEAKVDLQKEQSKALQNLTQTTGAKGLGE